MVAGLYQIDDVCCHSLRFLGPDFILQIGTVETLHEPTGTNNAPHACHIKYIS